MRTSLLICVLFVCLNCFGQTKAIKAELHYEDTALLAFGWIVFPKTHDSIKVTDYNLSIPVRTNGNETFYLTTGDVHSRVFRFKELKQLKIPFVINLPDTSFYEPYRKSGKCPLCLNKKNVIPIVYGFPIREDFLRAEKGKIFLMGCDQPAYPSERYCKKDSFFF
jgi:hypothetical protein